MTATLRGFKAVMIGACIVVVATSASALLAADDWKAGVSRVVITPDKPTWMSGYAARNKPAEGTLHDLWVKALAIEDSQGRRGVVITLDLCGIDRQFAVGVCDALVKEHKLERSQIVLCVSHTHSGPVIDGNLAPMFFLDDVQQERVRDYTAKLREQVIDIADAALRNLKPAELHWGLGQATFAVNRRNNKENEVSDLRAAGKLKGPVDHDVLVLAVKTADGKPLAILFGYACHATTLDGYQWSGDYPGEAQIELEKRHPTATAFFVAGCGADQNPLPRRKVELSQIYGQQLAAAVDDVLRSPLKRIGGAMKSSFREIELPFASLPSRQQLEETLQSPNKYEAKRARLLLDQSDAGNPLAKTYPYPIQTWAFDDELRLVWLGGEVVVDYSLRLKDELSGPKTWIAGYSNDVMAYIPSRRVLGEGGYEGGGAMVYYGLPSPWSDEVEKLIVDEVKRQAALGQ